MSCFSTAHYFLEALNEIGIEYLFCNFGTDYAPIIEEMARWDAAGRKYPKVVLCPHENVAIHMAGGYAWMTGRGQAVMVHVDVGTGNTINGMHNMLRTRTPVLLIAGRTPYTLHGELPGTRDGYVHFLQDVYDPASLVRPYTKWEYNLVSGVIVKEVLRRAHSIAHSDPRGAAYLTFPRETLMQEWDSSLVASYSTEAYGPTSASGADDETICCLADQLLAANNPALMTGYSGRNPACPAVLQELAELLGIKVFECGAPFLNISRSSAAFAGFFLPPSDLAEIDLGLLIDVDVPWIPKAVAENYRIRWIQVDVDPVKKDIPMWGFPTHVRIQADSYKLLKRLLEIVKQRITPEIRELARRRLQQHAAAREAMLSKFRADASKKGERGQINASYLFRELSKVIGDRDIVVNEGVCNATAADLLIPRSRPETYIGAGGSGLGFGGGAALGAKLAKPDVNVFHITGDGSFYFSNPAAVQAVSSSYQLPTFTVVLDNSGWAAVKTSTLAVYPDGVAGRNNNFHAVLAHRPRLEKIAEAFGAYGKAVDDPEEVPMAIARCMDALNGGRSVLLVARITRL